MPRTRRSRLLPGGDVGWDLAVGAVTAVALLAGLARPGYPLLRDMVATPAPPLSDDALGLGWAGARAVPQDVVMVAADRVVAATGLPTWPILGLLTACFCLWIAVAAGALVRAVLPGTPAVVRSAAVFFALWNPFVVERLLQGHWSLLAGVAAVLTIAAVCARPGRLGATEAGLVAVSLAAGGFTPTGWLLAVITLGCVAAFRVAGARRRDPDRRDPDRGDPDRGDPDRRHPRRRGTTASPAAVGIVAVALPAAAAPWLVSTLLAGSAPVAGGSEAVAAFAARAEPGITTLGSAIALGGIWNSHAVPPSRQTLWAAAALALLLAMWALAAPVLWRARTTSAGAGVTSTVALAVAAVGGVAFAATTPGQALLTLLVDTASGFGLARDTQKFLALALPATVLAAAAAGTTLTRVGDRERAGGDRSDGDRSDGDHSDGNRASGARHLAAAGAVLAVAVASVPDAPVALWRALQPTTYGPGWSAVADRLAAESAPLVVLPAGTVRATPLWSGGAPVLDPAPRLLPVPVLTAGDLVVGGETVSGAGERGRRATAALLEGADARELAGFGVGWVLDQRTSAGPRGESAQTLAGLDERFADGELALYRVPGDVAALPGATGGERRATLAAHALWALVLLAGAGVAVAGRSTKKV